MDKNETNNVCVCCKKMMSSSDTANTHHLCVECVKNITYEMNRIVKYLNRK